MNFASVCQVFFLFLHKFPAVLNAALCWLRESEAISAMRSEEPQTSHDTLLWRWTERHFEGDFEELFEIIAFSLVILPFI